MENFADQCLDLAQSLLSHNLNAIQEDGSITPVEDEASRIDESGHAALAIGEFFRATQKQSFEEYDLVDLAARCVTAQVFTEANENGIAYAALGLLSFGPAKSRNPLWERLMEQTQEHLDERLLERSDEQCNIFYIGKAVTRYSMGLSKRDETGKLIDSFLEQIKRTSTTGFYDDDSSQQGLRGLFDISGVMAFVFIRQMLQLHSNPHLRERKLPSLRTFGQKYIRLLADMVRDDGLGWQYGNGIGAYGQMHCISLLLQGIRDEWIETDKRPLYNDILRRLFQFFFMTYVDQEHGFLVIRDNERDTDADHTTRRANFDAARYLSQWSRLARSIGGDLLGQKPAAKTSGRFVIFDNCNRKEQGVFIYRNANTGLHIQLPLVATNGLNSSSLAFPHCPGIFDWPSATYQPILQPELTFGEHIIVPSFYGKRCKAGLGLKRSFYFSYQQPELVNREGKIIAGLGSAKVSWTFTEDKVLSDFTFTVKNPIQLDSMRYVIAFARPHSTYCLGTTYTLGEAGLRCEVLKDDFLASWNDTETVSYERDWRTCYGNIHAVQVLKRDHALVMRPAQQYKLSLSFQPDIAFAQE